MATDRLLEEEFTVLDGTSEPILLESFTYNNQRKYRPKVLAFSLLPIESGSHGKIQFSFDIRARIENETALWIDWKEGFVSEPTVVLIFAHIAAFRIVAEGEVRVVVRGD